MAGEKKKRKNTNGLIVILGPTASGKTALSIKLAKKFSGEVVSSDSRQVYKGMDIGSGKITKKEMRGVPHYLLDVANPKKRFTVSQYQKLALKSIKKIHQSSKIPFLVGGSPFYINSVVDGTVIPEVKPNWKLRRKLEKLTVKQMFEKLEKIDPVRAKTIDQHNPRRLLRALEIVLTTKRPVPQFSAQGGPASGWNTLKIGIKKSPVELKTAIHKRLLKRLKNDKMINEIKNLRKTLSWKRLEEFGLEYRATAQYLQNKITWQEMIDKIKTDSWHLVKKQMTWFSRPKGYPGGSAFGGRKIHWVKNYKQAEKLVLKFLEK